MTTYRSTPVHPGETHTPLDADSFEAVVRDAFPALAWDALSILGDVDAAIETVERVFVDAWQARHELRSVEALRPTLGAAVRHDAIRERTLRAARRTSPAQESPTLAVPGVEQTWERVRRAIGLLAAAEPRPALASGAAREVAPPAASVVALPPSPHEAPTVADPAQPAGAKSGGQPWSRPSAAHARLSAAGTAHGETAGRSSARPSTRRPAMRSTAAHRIAEMGHVKERRRTRIVAGSLLGAVALAALAWFVTRPASVTRLDEALLAEGSQAVAPAAGDRAVIELTGGSRVTIAPLSRLVVPQAMPKRIRGVRLEGTALFDIAVDEGAPFLVRTALGTVRVTGTRFAALADSAAGRLVVRVDEGSVTLEHGDSAFVVASGRGAVLRRDGTMEIVTDRYVAEALGWTGDSLDLAGRPLRDVLPLLPRWIGRDVVVADSTALDRRLDGLLPVSSPAAAEADLASRLGLEVDTTDAGTRLVSSGARTRAARTRQAASRQAPLPGRSTRTRAATAAMPSLDALSAPDVVVPESVDLPPPPKIRRPPAGTSPD